jgi:hypothetical protein
VEDQAGAERVVTSETRSGWACGSDAVLRERREQGGLMSNVEQRVRTMCGWIGVEISRSRVRTSGKAGYGLWRVRGSRRKDLADVGPVAVVRQGENPPMDMRLSVPTEWTAYAFTLEEIERGAVVAIDLGTPDGPFALHLSDGSTGPHVVTHWVSTRWTPAYRGRRDLGVSVPGTVKLEVGAEVEGRRAPVGAGLRDAQLTTACQMMALDWARTMTYEQMDRWRGAHSHPPERTTVRQRQREQNAAFQADHLERRAHGLKARHAAKLARMHSPGTTET